MSLLVGNEHEIAALHRGTRRFLIISVLLLLVVLAAILVRQGLFRPTVTLGFVAPTAQDISKGMAVKIAGFRIGSVSTITLRPDGQVDVAMDIDADYLRFVTQDAVVDLRNENLVGSPSIEIIAGPDRSLLAAPDSRLRFSRAEGLTAIANQLRAEIQPILRDIKQITGALADPGHGVGATLAQLQKTNTAVQTLLATSNQQAQELGGQAGRVLNQAEADLTQLGQTLALTQQRLPALLDTTQKILHHADTIGADASQSVPPLLKEGGALATDVREIVAGAKQAWPIRNLVTAPGPAHLATDSDPRAEGGHGGHVR